MAWMDFGQQAAVAAALTLCLPNAAKAQVFDVTAGASTAYSTQGGAVTIRNEKSQTTFGIGLVNGHFAAGGDTARVFQGGSAILGQQDHRVDVPTDVFDASHTFYGTGLGYKSNAGDTHGVDAFVGLASAEGGSPLFESAKIQQKTALVQYRRAAFSDCQWVMTGIYSTHSALLGSYGCSPRRWLHYAATAGAGSGAPYAAASIVIDYGGFKLKAAYIYAGTNFQRGSNIAEPAPEPVGSNVTTEYRFWRCVIVSGVLQQYNTPAQTDSGAAGIVGPAVESSLKLASVGLQGTRASIVFSLLQSSAGLSDGSSVTARGSAVSIVARKDLGRISWTETLLHGTSGEKAMPTTLLTGVGIQVNPHLRIIENLNVTGSSTSFAHGGSWATSYSSFEVDYQTQYLVTQPQNPFRQVMVFDANIRLPRGLAVHASSTVDPAGKTVYTFQLGRSFSRDAAPHEANPASSIGINVVRGRVLDLAGQGVDGAALLIGSRRVYSDQDGWFLFRERRPETHELRVLTEEFLGTSGYVEVKAPRTVRSAAVPQVVEVVVARASVTEANMVMRP